MAIEPVPGDPSTEPVATAQQSHVAGRVGPPTIAQDAAAPYYSPEGATQVEPGEEASADLAMEGGAMPEDWDGTHEGLKAAEPEDEERPAGRTGVATPSAPVGSEPAQRKPRKAAEPS